MELHQIRYFLALARSFNFTRAAEMCNVTQPALTKAVQKLELELGGVLIHRERQLTQLTDLGKLVLPMLERSSPAQNDRPAPESTTARTPRSWPRWCPAAMIASNMASSSAFILSARSSSTWAT